MGKDIEIITSTHNKYVSLARGLSNKKCREDEGLFRFDGVKLMCEAIKKGVELEAVLLADGEYYSVMKKAEKLYGIKEMDIKCRCLSIDGAVFSKISEERSPEGVICIARYMQNLHNRADEKVIFDIDMSENVLLLESVRDPQNLGAIVRAASALGTNRIIMSRDCADIYNSKAIRASMGAIFSMRVGVTESIPDAVGALVKSGRRVFASALDRSSSRLGEFEIKRGDCILIGNEGHGLTERAIYAAGNTVFIPMSDGVESLNAATAAAVLLWEFFGKRK